MTAALMLDADSPRRVVIVVGSARALLPAGDAIAILDSLDRPHGVLGGRRAFGPEVVRGQHLALEVLAPPMAPDDVPDAPRRGPPRPVVPPAARAIGRGR